MTRLKKVHNYQGMTGKDNLLFLRTVLQIFYYLSTVKGKARYNKKEITDPCKFIYGCIS